MQWKTGLLSGLLLGCSTLAHQAHAEIDWVSLIWHNDIFAHRDGGGYTNGVYISWYDISNEGEEILSPPLLTRSLLWMLDSDPQFTYSAYTLGQAMVTPKDISQVKPDPADAPYAGLLFLRSAYISVHENYADTVSTTIGVLGPASGAEKTQTFIHKITGSTEPQGWDSQLGNEPVGQIARTRIWRFSRDDHAPIDALITLNGALGNLESSVGSSFMLRVGSGLKKSFSSAAMITGRISNPMAIDGGWYLYVGATVDYVHNQIFVNGNTFRISPSASLKHEQRSLVAGMTYAWKDFSVAVAYQDGTSLDINTTARQTFGAITLGWRL